MPEKAQHTTFVPEDLHAELLHYYGQPDLSLYNDWVIAQAIGDGHKWKLPAARKSTTEDRQAEDRIWEARKRNIVCYNTYLTTMCGKPTMLVAEGDNGGKSIKINTHGSYTAQLAEVCHRMDWPPPKWSMDSERNFVWLMHYAAVEVHDELGVTLAYCEDTSGDFKTARTREAVARLALEQLLEYDDK